MKKFMAFFLFVCSCVVFASCASPTEREIKKASKNLSTYNMDIVYSDHTLEVEQSINYVNASDINMDKIYLHLYPKAFSEGAKNRAVSASYMQKAYPNGASYGDISIDTLAVAGKEIEPTYQGDDNDILTVETNGLKPNDSLKLSVTYTVVIPNCNHRFGYGENAINIANFYPIVAVYDGEWNLDPYNTNGDPFYSDVANYSVRITAPSDLTIANTGEVKKSTTSGDNTTYEITALAVRDFAFCLSDKFGVATEKYQNVEVKYYYYDDVNFSQSLKTAVDSIKTFNKLFGLYPYSTFSVVKTNFIYGGMEYPNLVMISDACEDYKDYQNVIIHETAHQWWYGLVGNNEYDYGWLDEGLTDYSTALFYKYNLDYEIKFEDVIKNTTNSYVTFVEIYTKVLGKVDTTMNRPLNKYNTEPEYVYIAYVKGVLLFDSLRENCGDEKFLKALSTYFKTNKFKNVTPDHLIGAFEKTMSCEMKGFFDSWINGKVVIYNVE